VDYHRDSGNPVAARLFRSGHKSKDSTNRRLDPYFDRFCRHTHRIERVEDHIDL
jgi:hypothetical protein